MYCYSYGGSRMFGLKQEWKDFPVFYLTKLTTHLFFFKSLRKLLSLC